MFDVSAAAGYKHVPEFAEVSGALPSATSASGEAGEADNAARHEWAIPTTVIEHLPQRDRRELAVLIKEFIVAYDVATHAELMAKLGATASSGSRTGAGTAARIREGLLREFVLNSHLFLMVVQHEYEAAIIHGATAGDDYKDTAASAQTGTRKRSVTLTRSKPPAADEAGTDRGSAAQQTGSAAQQTRSAQLKARAVQEQRESEQRLQQLKQGPRRTTTADLKRQANKDDTRMRPYMGFRVEQVSTKNGPALRVCSVAEGSPATDADLREGDTLLRFANYKATDLPSFNAIVTRHAQIGKALPIIVLRGTEKIELSVTIAGRFPDSK